MIVNNVLAPYQSYNLDTAGKGELGKDDFLQLLILQLQNQDPLDPLKNEDFISQLAQFNSLEQMVNLNRTMEALGNLQILSQTASLVGRQVEAMETDGTTFSGSVTAVEFKDGVARLVVRDQGGNDHRVTIDRILSVK